MTKITASDGFVLTNGEIYADKVCLGKNASADAWVEVELTDELYAECRGMYRDYVEGKTYTDGEHIKSGLTLYAYRDGAAVEIRTFEAVEEAE